MAGPFRSAGFRAGTGRARAAIALTLVLVVLAACGRSGGPAPVNMGKGGETRSDGAPARAAPLPYPDSGHAVVRRGDSVSLIAARYRVPLGALIAANDLAPPYTIHPGQRLLLPRPRAHIVARGDTVYGIARRYGIQQTALVRHNRLRSPDTIYPGQRLELPPQSQPPSPAEPPPKAPARDTAVASVEPPPPRPAPVALAEPPARTGARFLWPVEGPVVLDYGPRDGGRHNDGINIAAPRGTSVRAADDGIVAYAGNQLRGFGNLLLIRHADGWLTAYAHNDALLVGVGDTVRRGQTIARVGTSGTVDTPQLHFELRRGRRAVDPNPHLEPLAVSQAVTADGVRAARRDPG